MLHHPLRSSLLLVLTTLLVWSAGSQLHADYYQYRLFTVEWLVDNSDVIAVLWDKDEGGTAEIRNIKGDAKRLSPLQKVSRDGYDIWDPPSGGPVRLVFVRGKSELLQEVMLSRIVTNNGDPTVREIIYGVDEYGNLLLSETALFQAIAARLKIGPGHFSRIHRSATWVKRFGPRGAAVHAPSDFPLETSESTYVMIVPFTTERRDHFIQILKNGNALERVQAIKELVRFDDEKALNAIREATLSDNATPAFCPHWGTAPFIPCTAKSVQKAAKKALESR